MTITKSRIDPKPTAKSMAGQWSYYKSQYPTYEQAREKFFATFKAWGVSTSTSSYWSSSTITYDTGREKFNFCDHTQRRFAHRVYDLPCYRYAAYSTSSKWYFRGEAYAYEQVMALPSVSAPSLEITEEMRAQAWADLLPQLNDGFSLANFIWEIKDIPRLLVDIGKVLRSLRSLSKIAKNANTLTLAKAQLTWSFAVSPLMGDLQNIIDILTNFRKKVNQFIDQGKQVLPYHHRRDLFRYTSKVPNELGSTIDEVSVVYAATLRASYVYKQPNDWELFSRIAGLRITPEVIWNAIPLSFIIDWFIKIGDALRNLDRDPHLTIKVHDYCDSLKKVKSRKVVFDESCWTWDSWYKSQPGFIESMFISSDDRNKTGWELADISYIRIPGEPNMGYSFPVLDTLSARELVLAGALMRTSISR